jgi:hypothetical protein
MDAPAQSRQIRNKVAVDTVFADKRILVSVRIVGDFASVSRLLDP